MTSGYILYQGSRDELNELCRKKDDEIDALKAEIERLRSLSLEGREPVAKLLEDLDGEIDKQLYDDDYVKSCRDSDLDIPLDCEHHIVITERMRRDISKRARAMLSASPKQEPSP